MDHAIIDADQAYDEALRLTKYNDGNTKSNTLYWIATRRQTEGGCKEDSECNTKDCFYCLSNGTCGKYHREYCDTNTCGEGDGDCDPGTCPSGMACGIDNFLEYHPLLSACVPSGAEVC